MSNPTKIELEIDTEKLKNLDNQDFSKEIAKTLFDDTKIKEIKKYFFGSESSGDDQIKIEIDDFSTIGYLEHISYYKWWYSVDEFENITNYLKSEYNIPYWKRIKGDGNCFFRSVLIQFLEFTLIKCIEDKNDDQLICLIKDILFENFDKSRIKYRNQTISLLLYIQSLFHKGSYSKMFEFMYVIYNKIDIFEKTMIYWLKIKLKSFLKANYDVEINGMKFLNLIPNFEYDDNNKFDENVVEKYIEESLVKMNEFVEGYPLYITPIVLKINLEIYSTNKKDDKYQVIMNLFDRKSTDNQLKTDNNFLMEISSNNLKILFRSCHYESLYKNTDKEILLTYNNDLFILEENFLEYEQYNERKINLISKKSHIKNNLESIFKKQNNKKTVKNTSIKHEEDTILKNDLHVEVLKTIPDPKIAIEPEQTNEQNKLFSLNSCSICNEHKVKLVVSDCKHFICSDCLISNINIKLKYKTQELKYYQSNSDVMLDLKYFYKQYYCPSCYRDKKSPLGGIYWEEITEILNYVYPEVEQHQKKEFESKEIIIYNNKTAEFCDFCKKNQGLLCKLSKCNHKICNSCYFTIIKTNLKNDLNSKQINKEQLLILLKKFPEFKCQLDNQNIDNFSVIFDYFSSSIEEFLKKEEKNVICKECKKELLQDFERIRFNCDEIFCLDCVLKSLSNKHRNWKRYDFTNKNIKDIKHILFEQADNVISCPNCRDSYQSKNSFKSNLDLKKFLYYLECYEKKVLLKENYCKCFRDKMTILNHGCIVCKVCQSKIIFNENSGNSEERVYFKKGENEDELFKSNTCLTCHQSKIDQIEKGIIFGNDIVERELDLLLK